MSSRSARAIWIVLIVLVAARALAPAFPLTLVWGLDPQRFLGPVAGWALWALAALSLVPAVARRIPLEGFGDLLVRARPMPWVAGLVVALLVWVLPDRTWFVGDFLMRQGNVESGFAAGNYVAALPLDWFLHSVLLQPFGAGSSEAANAALRALGALEAFVLGVLAVALARALELRGSAAAAAAGLVVFGGYLTMFTGLGKPASELCLLVLALGIAGIRVARGRGSLLPAGVALAIALCLHRSSLVLVPAYVLVLGEWRRARPKGARGGWKTWAGIALPALAALLSLPRIVTLFLQYDLAHHVNPGDVRRQGILAAAFSGAHLIALLDLALALSPLFLAGLALLALRRDALRAPAAGLVLLLAGSFAVLMLFVHPQQGLFRDWDVFAPAGIALSMLTACLVAPVVLATRWLAAPLLLCALVPSLQWLLLNHEAESGLRRVRAYALEASAARSDPALAWDFLAARFLRLRRWPEAADAAEHAARLAPHRRILLMWAIAETLKPDDASADRVYREMLRKDPGDPLAWLGLAGTSVRLGRPEDARRAVEQVRAFESDSSKAREMRRHLEFFPQVWPGPLP